MRIIIRERSHKNIFGLIKDYFKTRKTIKTIKRLVDKALTYEEESLMYNYTGKDKEDIWAVMELFYENLYEKEFDKFRYTDMEDDWENYNFYVKYKNKYSQIILLYGIGSTCIIKAVEESCIKTDKLIIDLDNIKHNLLGEIYY